MTKNNTKIRNPRKKNPNNYWSIEGDNYMYDTLSDAKYHCDIAYTPKERVKYLKGTYINHVVNGETFSCVEIKVDENGKLSFGKVEKIGFFGKLFR